MTLDQLLVAPLYVACYFSFVRLLRFPRNWLRCSLQSVLTTAVLVIATIASVSVSANGIDPVSLLGAAGLVIVLFGAIAAPSIAFRPVSSFFEFLARRGEYAGVAIATPAVIIMLVIGEVKLIVLGATALLIELAWWSGRLRTNRSRPRYRLTDHDLSVLHQQASGNLERFAKRHGIHELQSKNGAMTWRGCGKNTLPCPFNLYVNRLGLNTAPCCRQHMMELCTVVHGWLEELNVVHWIEGGTLLGAVRDGRLLPWEDDVDVSVLIEDDLTWRSLAKGLYDRGKRDGFFVDAYQADGFFTVCYDPPQRRPFQWQRNRMRGEIRLDLTVYRRVISYGRVIVERRTRKGNMPATEQGRYGILQDIVTPTSKIDFLGDSFSCPRQPQEYLRVLYGDYNRVEYSYVDPRAARTRRGVDAANATGG